MVQKPARPEDDDGQKAAGRRLGGREALRISRVEGGLSRADRTASHWG